MKKIISLLFVSVLVGCGGGESTSIDSNNAATTSINPMYSIDTNTTSISYPSSYNTLNSNIQLTANDPCKLNFSTVNIPKDWMGQFPLPQIKNTTLNKNIIRSVSVSDIILHGNPGFILDKNCSGDSQSELTKTVNRLKALGVEQISLAQWHWAGKNHDGSWYFTKAEDTYSSLPDVDLAALVKAAHNAGIKVLVMNQIQGMSDNPNNPNGPNAYIPENTYENQVKWFNAFEPFVIERAKYFQSIGIDAMDTACGSGCIFNTYPENTIQSNNLYRNRYTSIISNVRSVFSGKLVVVNPFLESEFLNLIDIIVMYPVPSIKLTAEENSKLTVESYLTKLKNSNNDKILRWWLTNNKPIMINFGIQSRSNALTDPDWLEESNCTVSPGLFSAYTSSTALCIQNQTKPDFSLQAIITEAILEYFNSLPLPPGSIVNVQDYWNTDVINPYTAFPNIGSSIRNKPAEGIIKAWYKK